MVELSPKEIVDEIWHWKVEDQLPWEFCHDVLIQDGYSISQQEMQEGFINYFVDLVGIAPYVSCPKCGETLLPRKSRYGYFIGCSAYPCCKYTATKYRKYESELSGEYKCLTVAIPNEQLIKAFCQHFKKGDLTELHKLIPGGIHFIAGEDKSKAGIELGENDCCLLITVDAPEYDIDQLQEYMNRKAIELAELHNIQL